MNRLARRSVHFSVVVIVVALTALWTGSRGNAQRLVFAGVCGNSGEGSVELVRQTYGRLGGGVAVDSAGRIWTGGGDRLLVFSPGGKQLWSTMLTEPGWVVGFPTFAVANGYLYFFAGKPYDWDAHYYQAAYTMVEPNLIRVKMTPSAVPDLIVPNDQFRAYTRMDATVATNAADGSVYVGFTTGVDSPEYTIYKVEGSHLTPAFTKPMSNGRFAIDEQGFFLVAGNNKLGKYDAHGAIQPGPWPFDYTRLTPFTATYSGAIMLTSGALWQMSGYGFLGKYTRESQPNPGVVASQNESLFQTEQIIDAPGGRYYIKSNEALYLGELVNGQMRLLRRYGSIPRALALGVTPGGFVGVGDEDLMCWYDFRSTDPAAPPINAQYFGPSSQCCIDSDALLGVDSAGYPNDMASRPKTFRLLDWSPQPAGTGNIGKSVATASATTNRIVSIATAGSWCFAVDSKGALLSSANGDNVHFHSLDVNGADSVTACGKDRLIVASGGLLQSYNVEADGSLTETWSLTGTSAADPFGNSLQTAFADGELLVADTKRNRVLLFVLEDPARAPRLAAQYGERDVAGDDDGHFDAPTLVGMAGGRAVVYDSGNQRIIKFDIR